MVYKCRNNLAPGYLTDLFTPNSINHTHYTRHSESLRATKSRTVYYEKSFTISGHRLWNGLPSHIRDSPSISSFKSNLYSHLGARSQFPNNRRYQMYCFYYMYCFYKLHHLTMISIWYYVSSLPAQCATGRSSGCRSLGA